MHNDNPYWFEPIWLSYKHGVLNRLREENLTDVDKESIAGLAKQYKDMGETMAIYDDLVAAGASEERLKQYDDDLKAKRFADYDDPVNEYRRAYGLTEIERFK